MQQSRLLATAAVAVVGLGVAAASAARSLPVQAKIAFSSNRSGDTEIYVMNADGSGVRRLTHSPKFDAPSEWSSDRTKLLFYTQRSAGGGVWVMNADGTGQRNLTKNAAHSSAGRGWSPDGKQIAFDSNRDGNDQVYV